MCTTHHCDGSYRNVTPKEDTSKIIKKTIHAIKNEEDKNIGNIVGNFRGIKNTTSINRRKKVLTTHITHASQSRQKQIRQTGRAQARTRPRHNKASHNARNQRRHQPTENGQSRRHEGERWEPVITIELPTHLFDHHLV